MRQAEIKACIGVVKVKRKQANLKPKRARLKRKQVKLKRKQVKLCVSRLN